MRYEQYSEDATLEHFDRWTDTVGKQLDRITDPVLKDTLYELLHATLNYVDRLLELAKQKSFEMNEHLDEYSGSDLTDVLEMNIMLYELIKMKA
ncbi:hypothetical protein [Weissella sagaensis]|uniref:hypothetical protein n=1 Tax=Weissella sagaensis TaxID=2559928 RepID=UPI0013EB0E54|nr:hypothetical protein [Weissella sagaensis]